MSVTIRARLPKGDTNGLAHLESKLADNGDDVLVVVGLIRADTVEQRLHDEDDPRVVKTVLLHLEALDGKNADASEKLLRRAYEQRTGKRELPFEEPPAPPVVVDGNFPTAPPEEPEP
jgi:hypothetical protein